MTTAAHESHGRRRPRRHLFEDVSAVQVIATALAAVTSMLLSSYIGIAGSIIGVAVASVVSTLAASLYKRFLADSAEKIKELPVVSKTSVALSNVLPLHDEEGESEAGKAAADGASEEPPTADSPEESSGADGASPAAAAADGEGEGDAATVGATASGADGEAVEEARALAALRHQRRLVRGLVAVCIASALLAVAASAAVVYLTTMGDGLGEKPAPIYLSAPFDPIEDDASSDSSSVGAVAPPATSSSSASSSSSSSSSSSDSAATDPSEGEGGTGGEGDLGDGQGPAPEPPASAGSPDAPGAADDEPTGPSGPQE